jgi:hypothetical protein
MGIILNIYVAEILREESRLKDEQMFSSYMQHNEDRIVINWILSSGTKLYS